MKTWLKLGFGIGLGLAALYLIYMGTNMLVIQGLALQPGLLTLAGLACAVSAARFISDAQSEQIVKTIPPMPPFVPKTMEFPVQAKPMQAKKAPKKKSAKKKKGKR
jgi:hypothetical protein